MSYIVPIHRPSSIRHALQLNLMHPDEKCLVLAKTNRLEIWVPSDEGVRMVHSQSINGTISMLDAVRPAASETAHLFVGTQRFQYFTLAWNAQDRTLETVQSFVDVTEKQLRESESLDRCSVDPTGQHVVLELYEGVLNVAKLGKPKRGTTDYLGEPEQVRITELFVRDSAFLTSATRAPKYAMLYEDGEDSVALATYRVWREKGGSTVLELSDFDPARDREDHRKNLDPSSKLLIPVAPRPDARKRHVSTRHGASASVRPQLGGLLIVGDTQMMYYDDDTKVELVHRYAEPTVFNAWVQYDEKRFFLGDVYGNLQLLTLRLDGADILSMQMKRVATISKPNRLVYFQGLLVVASHEGDSQVLRVDPVADSYEVVQTLQNVAPILDFTTMDMGNRDEAVKANEFSSGQARLVTGSGNSPTGSLRSMRSGVGLQDLGLLGEMDSIREMFSLKGSAPFGFDDTLILSFPTETRVLVFDADGEVEERESFAGFSLSERTLLARQTEEGQLLQATATSITLSSAETGAVSATWQPPDGHEISSLSANSRHVLVTYAGTALVCLRARDLQKVVQNDLTNDDQVSCLHVPEKELSIALVGSWKAGTLSVVDVETLNVLQSHELRSTEDNAIVPRSMVMTQLLPEASAGPTILVAMSDGTVVTFVVDKHTYALSDRRSVVLGVQQPTLYVLPRQDGIFNVFAACEHSSLIYGYESRLVFSAVTAEDAACICPFDSEVYPNAIAIATATDLKISQVDEERRTHVNTLILKEAVYRLAYSPKEKLFGLATLDTELVDGEEITTSKFRLVDEVIFQPIRAPFVLDQIPGGEIAQSVIRAEFRGQSDTIVERFVVATGTLEERGLKIYGRILIFGVDPDSRAPYLASSLNLGGSCRCLAMFDGMIAAAVGKSVVLYTYDEADGTVGSPKRVTGYPCSTLPIDLVVSTNAAGISTIAVADLMKSLSLLEYEPGKAGVAGTLVEVARSYEPGWTTAVGHLIDDDFLQADSAGNLTVLSRNREGLTAEDCRRLKVTAEMSIGQMVSRIQGISVSASADAVVVPRAFLSTVEGAVLLFGSISPRWITQLLALQTALAETLSTAGQLPFSRFRALRTAQREAEEPFRCVDGELLEAYLVLEAGDRAAVARTVGMREEDLVQVVQELRRLH